MRLTWQVTTNETSATTSIEAIALASIGSSTVTAWQQDPLTVCYN